MESDLVSRAGARLAVHGLIPRGGFDFSGDEERPDGPSGVPARSVLLVGNAGASYWRHFSRWREAQATAVENPLDTWSRMVIGEAARHLGARVLMPNDRPYAPFQQWAGRAEGLRASPLGILIHPDFGLWHAYRGAMLFDRPIARAPRRRLAIHATDVGKSPAWTPVPSTPSLAAVSPGKPVSPTFAAREARSAGTGDALRATPVPPVRHTAIRPRCRLSTSGRSPGFEAMPAPDVRLSHKGRSGRVQAAIGSIRSRPLFLAS